MNYRSINLAGETGISRFQHETVRDLTNKYHVCRLVAYEYYHILNHLCNLITCFHNFQ